MKLHEQLDELHNIGLEGINVANPIEFFKGTFNQSFFQNLKERAINLFGGENKAHLAVKEVTPRMRGWLERESYLALDKLDVFIPVGLAVPYRPYLDTLNAIAATIDQQTKLVLDGSIAAFGYYINNAAATKAHSVPRGPGMNQAISNEAKSWVATQSDILGKCFGTTHVKDTAPFTKMFARNAEVAEVVKLTDQLNNEYCVRLPKEIEKKVLQLIDLSERFANLVREDDSYHYTTKAVLGMLTERLRTAAEFAEFFAVYSHSIYTLNVAVSDTVKKIERIAK